MNPAFRDILSAFTEEKVEFMVVGAFAMAFYGLPRSTGDIDLWISTAAGNAVRVMRAIARFGAPVSAFAISDLEKLDMVLQLGVEPRRIDILTSIDGIEFSEAVSRVQYLDYEELRIPMIGWDELIRNKKASGRPQDLVDVAWLEANCQ